MVIQRSFISNTHSTSLFNAIAALSSVLNHDSSASRHPSHQPPSSLPLNVAPIPKLALLKPSHCSPYQIEHYGQYRFCHPIARLVRSSHYCTSRSIRAIRLRFCLSSSRSSLLIVFSILRRCIRLPLHFITFCLSFLPTIVLSSLALSYFVSRSLRFSSFDRSLALECPAHLSSISVPSDTFWLRS